MAPEVHRKRAYGAPVDVFAYGVVRRWLGVGVGVPYISRLQPYISRLQPSYLQVLRKLLSRVQAPPGSLLCDVCMPALYSLTTSSRTYERMHCARAAHPAWPAYLGALARDCCVADPEARPTFREVLRRLDASATPRPSGEA